MAEAIDFGAFVISLDFELHWGVRDKTGPHGSYRRNLLGARKAIPMMLDLFEEFGIAATWATVGFLFAERREALRRFHPIVCAGYEHAALDPYQEPVGECEKDDPLHYAPDLIRLIGRTPRQEIGSHTFSHYYCLEPGQGSRAFAADLASAVSIAREAGIELRSIVFPRNQINPEYLKLLPKYGIVCYRGVSSGWMHRARPRHEETLRVRAARLIDQYVNLSGTGSTEWRDIPVSDELCNVPASLFLRPYSPRMRAMDAIRLARIVGAIRMAARSKAIFHLWWHPHNFGDYTAENLKFLRAILVEFSRCRSEYGMASMSMQEVAETAARVEYGAASGMLA